MDKTAPRKTSIVSQIVAHIASRFRKSRVGMLHDTTNPLWNIDEQRIEMLHDVARTGNVTMMQYLFNEIEANDPTLLICASRRAAALSELDWKIVQSDVRRLRSADKTLVQEQIACLEEAVSSVANLPEAVEHLALAPFRGFSAVAPSWDVSRSRVWRIDLIDTWNMSYNRAENCWMWNPDARPWSAVDGGGGFEGLEMILPDQIVVISKKRAIDWPALKIYLRIAVGERDWGKFLETYGLPPVILTMPEMTTDDDVDKYMKSAEAVFEGKNGVVPYGTNVSYGSESRGVNPFTEFIEHNQKLVVMMATGGTLTTLAESGSGTLAGGAQMDVWRQIVRSDAKVLGNAIDKQLCNLILRRQKDFKGKQICAEFQFETEPPLPAKDVLELAGLASSAGFEMDAEELSQKTGYKIRRKPDAGGIGFNSKQSTVPVTEAAHKQPVRAHAKPRAQHAPAEPSARNAAGGTNAAAEDLARSLQSDFREIADRINQVLALPEGERPEAASKLAAELDDLVPDDPAMAEVIAEQMEKAFQQQ